MKVKCPKCGREMELGYFYAQRALWSKNESKFTILRGKEDVKICASGSPAYRCESCCEILVTIAY